MSYTVKFYTGDYKDRQLAANADGAVGYVEQHFNSSSTASAGYASVVVGSNASETSKNWGRWYAQAVASHFGIGVGGDNGVWVGGVNGRGNGNVYYTNMPAILLEPLFCSNPQHAEWIKSQAGQHALADILVRSVQRFRPQGGVIAFSVGHKGKRSNPGDRGAVVYGGGSEADYAEKILELAATQLQTADTDYRPNMVSVEHQGAVVWSMETDEDAELIWDEQRRKLTIR